MSFKENGLEITVFPPDGEKIAPNGNSTTKVNITNKQHQLGIRLGVSLNLKAQLQSWCKIHQYSITVGYQQSQEVEFVWNIPIEAAAGTYNYYLNVEFLRSTSFYSFQPKVRQLTILPTIVTPQINNIEPSFAIARSSSSTRQIILSCKETLNLEIEVHNRSNRTDNFRVSTDLEPAWYVIRYPEVFEKIGAVDGGNALNLNPREKGKINLQITPPAGTIAGNYNPEIKLHSLNSPELFLKKIVYLNIPAEHILEAELKNILNQVSYKKGQYDILLTNKGNTFRKLELQVKSSDENECCEYFLAKYSVKISPNKTIETRLEVRPKAKQKKSFLKTQQFNFQVDLIDSNNYPLPKNLPLKSNLLVRSRPLWQLVFLVLLVLGVLGVSIWGIRRLFPPQSEPKITLKPEKVEYPYGKTIALEWTIENYQGISSVKLFDKALGVKGINTQCYILDSKSTSRDCIQITPQNLPDNCQIDKKVASCSNIIFLHAKAVKDYTFELEASRDRGESIVRETKVSILPKPIWKIFKPIKVSSTKYQPTEQNSLSFEASNINNLVGEDKVFLLIDNKRQAEPVITPKNIGKICPTKINNLYSCTINIPPLNEGEHSLGIELQYDLDGRKTLEPKQFVVPEPIVIQTPIALNYFKINDSDSGTLEVEANTPITVSWSVTGSNAKVNLDCVGGQLDLQGIKTLNVPEGTTQTCTLEILDESGKSIDKRTLGVKVAESEPPQELKPKNDFESFFDSEEN